MTDLIAVLALVLGMINLFILMRTQELNLSVSTLATNVSALAVSVDAAVVALGKFKNVTPDADVDAAIVNIDTQTTSVNDLRTKLDAALNPTT